MVLLGLEVLTIVYIATRIVENNALTQIINKFKKNNLLNHDVKAIETEKQIDHHLKVSGVSIATTLIGSAYYPAKLMSLGLISYNIMPIIKETEKSLLVEKQVKNDLINSIVSIVCIGTGQYFSAALVAGLYYIGDKMVIKTQDRSKAMINDVFQLHSNQVLLLTHENKEIEIAIENVKVNDVIVINAGNIVPVDGQVVEGAAMIDQHALTGESVLVEKKRGEHVLASTLVISGKIFVKIEHAGLETNAAKIRDILKHTTEYKTSLQSRGEQWADKVALPLIGAAGLLVPVIGILPATALLYTNPGNSIKTFVSLQTVNYLISLSKQGVLIKDGRALEELFKVDTVLFDKTPALAIEAYTVGEIISCSELSKTQILNNAATAEYEFTDPIAQAIVKQAQENELTIIPAENADYHTGYGITVHQGNHIIQVGSLEFMEMEGISVPSFINKIQQDWHQQGHSLVTVAINQQIKGVIEIKPQLRPEFKAILDDLRQHQIKHIGMIFSEHQQPTQLAEILDSYFYEVLPSEKVTIIKNLQKQGKTVCFVGDGINDAVAMKQANVSVSFSDASTMTTDSAQIVLMDGNISHLPALFKSAQSLSLDTKRILSLLGTTTGLVIIGTLFSKMRIIGAVGLEIVENVTGFGYVMRPLKSHQTTQKITLPHLASSPKNND